MSDSTPNWDIIGHCLKSILSKYDLDLSDVGVAQRLEYVDFEKIFYHLFLIIDPVDCRRRFWSIYPARNQEEKSKFFENTTQFINTKQLSSYRISASQLRMCGGEPFRRLLSHLIKKAAELESNSIAKKLAPESQSLEQPDLRLEECLDSLDELRTILHSKLIELKDKVHEYNDLQETLAEKKRDLDDTWEMLTTDVLGDTGIYEYSISNMKEIHKLLVAKLEKSNAQCSAAVQKIRQIQVSIEDSLNESDMSISKQDTSTRMSHLFKEMREYLTMSPECSAGTDASKIINRISHQLMHYDNGVDGLASLWEEELERADEALLEKPDMKERYQFFENLIPFLDLKPISIEKLSIETEVPKISDLHEILESYLDPRYDNKEILEISKKIFLE